VTGSATALEKERRERRNIRAAMEGKGREGKRDDEFGGWTLLLAAAWTLQKKRGTKTRGPPQSSLLGFGALLSARE
jgi:hypothetical protein